MINTDFEKGFIRAETIGFQDYIAGGGEAGAKDSGKMRLEGKEYVVHMILADDAGDAPRPGSGRTVQSKAISL